MDSKFENIFKELKTIRLAYQHLDRVKDEVANTTLEISEKRDKVILETSTQQNQNHMMNFKNQNFTAMDYITNGTVHK